jgi:hypothetical protein
MDVLPFIAGICVLPAFLLLLIWAEWIAERLHVSTDRVMFVVSLLVSSVGAWIIVNLLVSWGWLAWRMR